MSDLIRFEDKYTIEQLGGYYRKHSNRVKKKIKNIKEIVEKNTIVEKKI